MSPRVVVSSLLDLMRLPPGFKGNPDPKAVDLLEGGIQEFLQEKDLISTGEAGLLAGSIQIDAPELVLETMLLASTILSGMADPNAFVASIPSVGAWLLALYQNCTLLDRTNGELCVYRTLLSGSDSNQSAKKLFSSLSCQRSEIDKKCGMVKGKLCKITIPDINRALISLGKKNLAFSTGGNSWQGRS
jgi:hypothetical protein